MEQVFKAKQNGWIIFIQDSSEGGFDFTIFDSYGCEVDGGLLETNQGEYDTPITVELVKKCVDSTIPNTHPQRSYIETLEWEKSALTRDDIDEIQDKDFYANIEFHNYYDSKIDLETLHDRLKSIFGSIKSAALWLWVRDLEYKSNYHPAIC